MSNTTEQEMEQLILDADNLFEEVERTGNNNLFTNWINKFEELQHKEGFLEEEDR